jgi:uroporphyrinogen decarboxylase
MLPNNRLMSVFDEASALTPPPIWLMRQAGRYLPEYRSIRAEVGSFLQLCYTPSLAVEVTLQPIRRFDFDAAIIFSDILLILDAMDRSLRFDVGEGPVLAPLEPGSALPSLDLGAQAERLAPVYSAITETRAVLDSDKALIGFAGAPWTLACYAVNGCGGRFDATVLASMTSADWFQGLIDDLTKRVADHLCRQLDAGADVVQIFDSWAGALDLVGFECWCIAPIRAIVDLVRAHAPNVPIIVFPRQAGDRLSNFVTRLPDVAISVDQFVDLAAVRRTVGSDMVLQGNLDPLALVAGGEALARRWRQLAAVSAAGPHIVNLGHGIRQETSIAHVEQLITLVRNGSV